MFVGKTIHRINASQLSQYRGKAVCVLGTPSQGDTRGMTLKLQTSDGSVVEVELPRPLDEYIEGAIEVRGIVTQKLTIKCNEYSLFSKEISSHYDTKLYEAALKVMEQHPEFYIKLTD